MPAKTRKNTIILKLAEVDNAIVACRARGHKWPDVMPGQPIPPGFRPVLQRDGCVQITETCGRCGKEIVVLTLRGGGFDVTAVRRYRNPPGWRVFKIEEDITRRSFTAEMYRRLGEDFMAAARTNALRRNEEDEG